MKRFLPKSANNPKGFTLIELLVVITIIAILSVIGIAVFSGVQKNARDARRTGDIDAISKAIEAQRTPGSTVYFTAAAGLQAAHFTAGVIPTDSLGTVSYCIATSTTTTVPTAPSSSTGSWAVGSSGSPSCPTVTGASYAKVDVDAAKGGTVVTWMVCGRLESSTTNSGAGLKVYCIPSSQ